MRRVNARSWRVKAYSCTVLDSDGFLYPPLPVTRLCGLDAGFFLQVDGMTLFLRVPRCRYSCHPVSQLVCFQRSEPSGFCLFRQHIILVHTHQMDLIHNTLLVFGEDLALDSYQCLPNCSDRSKGQLQLAIL